MSNKMNFEQIKSISKHTQYVAYGFIRRCQSLLPADDAYFIIPSLVEYTILLFYNDFELFQFNQSKTFRYFHRSHGDYFKLFGTNLIERKYTNEYEWKIETNESFSGRFGVVNDTNNISTSPSIINGDCYWRHPDVINIGSERGGHQGTEWGSGGGTDLDAFIAEYTKDIITINIDFVKDNISFTSNSHQRTITKKIKKGVESVRFVCECCSRDSEIKLLS